MTKDIRQKEAKLRRILAGIDSALVAFSGGVDSTLLASIACEVLDGRAMAVTAVSPAVPSVEADAARDLAAQMGIRHIVIETAEMESDEYVKNEADRCYHCKNHLFGRLRALADDNGLSRILDGTNADDADDFRPGRRAAAEHGVRSPLLEAGLTKEEIRALSRKRGLPTAEKPSMACLASRIPYGTPISREALAQIDAAEKLVRSLGPRQVRVRHHGPIARVEVEPGDIPLLAQEENRLKLVEGLRALGYVYVTLDMAGFRSGSLNVSSQ